MNLKPGRTTTIIAYTPVASNTTTIYPATIWPSFAPQIASSCSSPGQFSSACSCIGVQPQYSTAEPPVATSYIVVPTVTMTVSVSAPAQACAATEKTLTLTQTVSSCGAGSTSQPAPAEIPPAANPSPAAAATGTKAAILPVVSIPLTGPQPTTSPQDGDETEPCTTGTHAAPPFPSHRVQPFNGTSDNTTRTTHQDQPSASAVLSQTTVRKFLTITRDVPAITTLGPAGLTAPASQAAATPESPSVPPQAPSVSSVVAPEVQTPPTQPALSTTPTPAQTLGPLCTGFVGYDRDGTNVGYFNDASVTTYNGCLALCQSKVGCLSFGLTAAPACALYNYAVTGNDVSSPGSGNTFYDRACAAR